MPKQKPLPKAPARKSAKKAAPSKVRRKPAPKTIAAKARKKTIVKKTVVAKVTAKPSVAKKAPAKKAAIAAKSKSSVAFAKTTKPVTPLRERPLSPHLSIYHPQITSVLSIMHRGTGVALYLGAFAVAWLIACLGYGPNCFDASLALLNNIPGMIAIYLINHPECLQQLQAYL